jgi:hypothetical protein
MRNKLFTFALTGLLTVGMAGTAALAQDTTAPAAPQGPPAYGHHMNPDTQLQRLTKKLDLSTDQQSQIKPLLDSRQQQMQELWQDQSLSQSDRRTKAMGIQTDTNGKIEAVLSDTQKQQYEAMQAQMKQRAMRHKGSTPPPAGDDSSTPQQQ